MKKVFGAAVLFSLAFVASGQLARAGDLDVGVTIRGEIVPGVYGRVNLGAGAPPPVVYARPVTIEAVPAGVGVEPLYLHVPPDHARDWRRHCHEYHACNRPVYFVRSREYDPAYRHRPEFERRREEEEARAREIERARAYDREHEHGGREHADGRWDEHRDHEHDQRDHEDRGHERDHDHER